MVTFTTNKTLTLVANASYVGDWDVPTNANWSIMDSAFGGMTTLTLNNGVTVLSTAQSQNAFLTFQSTLTGACIIIMPTGVAGFYTVQNLCTGTSLYTVVIGTTNNGNTVGAPPGEAFDIICDGTNVKFRNFGRIGSYVEFAGSSLPNWVSVSSPQPYLNCDGTTFSSATYPALANLIGTTLPDSRGRTRFNLSQGTGRITSSAGIDGTTLFAAGGVQSVTLSSQQMPPVPITDPTHTHANTAYLSLATGGAAGSGTVSYVGNSPGSPAATGITAGSTSPTQVFPLPPGYVGGLTLIRAA